MPSNYSTRSLHLKTCIYYSFFYSLYTYLIYLFLPFLVAVDSLYRTEPVRSLEYRIGQVYFRIYPILIPIVKTIFVLLKCCRLVLVRLAKMHLKKLRLNNDYWDHFEIYNMLSSKNKCSIRYIFEYQIIRNLRIV